MTEEERQVLESKLEHRFRETAILEAALTHRSWQEGAAGARVDYERLEFLGDRVLGLVVSEYLSRTFPKWDVGKLSKGLARLVSAPSIQTAAQGLGLGQHLRLGRGEELTGGREKKNLLGDAYEAVLAALYLDAGLGAAAALVERSLLKPALAGERNMLSASDHKSALQEWLQHHAMNNPEYRVVKESGPDHKRVFGVELSLAGRRLAQAEGKTKKEAEQGAARAALRELREREDREERR